MPEPAPDVPEQWVARVGWLNQHTTDGRIIRAVAPPPQAVPLLDDTHTVIGMSDKVFAVNAAVYAFGRWLITDLGRITHIRATLFPQIDTEPVALYPHNGPILGAVTIRAIHLGITPVWAHLFIH
jgi:hypothetical protein